MIIFYDPNNTNQVMAVYSHNTTSKAWEEKGYIRADVNIPHLQTTINRDCFVALDKGEVIGVTPKTNPIQPTPNPRKVRIGELTGKLGTVGLNLLELNELAKLERGL